MSAENPTFRELVLASLVAVVEKETPLAIGKPLADRVGADLLDRLKRAGYSIHRSGECVHPRSRRDELGRPMTEEERKLLVRFPIPTDPAT